MPSGYCHQYFYANGSHLGGFTPRKSFSFTASRHYQLPSLPEECNTFLHINYISISYDRDAIKLVLGIM